MAAPVVSVEHLEKRYGDVVAVRDVSFEVHQGEIFGILGPNGCGHGAAVGQCRAPTARVAQAIGLVIWFVMLMLGGAGPPREALDDTMMRVSDATPLWYAVEMMQRPWLGLDAGPAWGIFTAAAALSAGLAVWLFRWE